MFPLLKKIRSYLIYRFIHSPAGGGKPVPKAALDNEYKSGAWDHFLGPEEKQRHEHLLELIYLQGPRFSLLDLGCGSGRLAAMLDPGRLTDYLGLDLSDEGLQRARALGLLHGKFEQADYTSWKPSHSYDIITFNESLGYAPDPASTAKAFASHLNPGGCLIVSHYRWGNHAAIWRRLAEHFQFQEERTACNDRGQIWDLKVLRLKMP